MPNFYDIADSVKIIDLTDSKFKTFRVAVKMVLPLNPKTASEYAMLTSIVSRVIKEYPEYTAFSRKLASLYGASIYADVAKMGDNQILSVALGGISGRYAFGGEKMEQELLAILISAVFSPLKDERGLFPKESFIQEKRQLLEAIDADFNDKRIFALDRAMKELFRNEKSGISKYGTSQSVKNTDENTLPALWDEALKKAKFFIFVSGDCDFKYVENTMKSQFRFEREPYNLTNETLPAGETLHEVCDEMKLSQSKLVVGFKTECKNNNALKLMSVIYGGSAISKLFMNVREKMSLCYYCSCRPLLLKKALFVESGVETEKLPAAKEAILNELEEIRKGNITEEEFFTAKLALYNSLNGIEDSLYSLEIFYQNQIFEENVITPKEQYEAFEKVTLDEVIEAAKLTKLDTVYELKGVIK
ncbi:MAG: insulinase family protein [Ruminococcaceae bacterium]|nr:insulinase family protein [Oscillospiraceae bacterium]